MTRQTGTEERVEETEVECAYRRCDKVIRSGDAWWAATRRGPLGPGESQPFCTEECFEEELGAVVDQYLDQQEREDR